MQMDSLETYITKHVQSKKLLTDNTMMLDIGAYHGDFTRFMLSESQIQKAILFEPNPENYEYLTNAFIDNKNISIINQAVGDEDKMLAFYCNNDLATGSVLQYDNHDAASSSVRCQNVKQVRVDDFVSGLAGNPRISFIKIDTQGYDLSVMKGAVNTIKHHQPWLVVELIFVPLYQQQAKPATIIGWLSDQGYELGGMYNMHHTTDGWLAFADAIFIPANISSEFETPYSVVPSVKQMQEEIDMLRAVCAERLDLINKLHNDAQKKKKRFGFINL